MPPKIVLDEDEVVNPVLSYDGSAFCFVLLCLFFYHSYTYSNTVRFCWFSIFWSGITILKVHLDFTRIMGMSCLVVSFLVLICLLLSCVVSRCLILCRFVLSCVVSCFLGVSCLFCVLPCFVLFCGCLVLSCSALPLLAIVRHRGLTSDASFGKGSKFELLQAGWYLQHLALTLTLIRTLPLTLTLTLTTMTTQTSRLVSSFLSPSPSA